MLKLGFALEGNSDYGIVPCLTHRIIAAHYPAIVFAEDSLLRPRPKGHGFIKQLPTFAHQLQAAGVDILVAVVDTDQEKHIAERRKYFEEAKKKCAEQGLFICIAEGLAVQKIEAWLLADERAIVSIFGGDPSKVAFPAPETSPDPKEALNHIVSTLTEEREISFASYATEIAEQVDLEILWRKCAYFRDFEANLRQCVNEWQRLASRP